MPFQFAVGPELCTGMNPSLLNLSTHINRNDAQYILLQGRCPLPNAAGFTDIWGYVSTSGGAAQPIRANPASGFTLAVVSDSVADVNTSGTGAWIVTVFYLDSSYNPWVATFALNGQTAVTVPTSIVNPFNAAQTITPAAIANCFRINGMEVTAVGTGTVNAGNIYAYDNSATVTAGVPQTAAKVYDCILIGDNLHSNSQFTIPANYYGMVIQISMNYTSAASTVLQGKMRVQFTKGNNGIYIPLYLGSTGTANDGDAAIDPCFAPIFQPQSELRAQAYVSSATACETQLLAALVIWPTLS